MASSGETPSAAVQRTWGLVTKNGQDNEAVGVMLFKEIFTIAPGAVTLFPFRDEPDMYNSKKLKVHALGVVKTVSKAVSLLGELDTLVPVLRDLGARHVDYGVVDAHYDVVGQALLTTLENGLSSEWTPEVATAWTGVWGVVASTMKAGAAEKTKSKQNNLPLFIGVGGAVAAILAVVVSRHFARSS